MNFIRNLFTKGTGIIDSPQKLESELIADLMAASGQRVTTQTAVQLSTIYSCIRVLCESVGMLPMRVYERDGNTRNLAHNHWLYSLLAVRPNSFMTPQELWEVILFALCTNGNFYALKTIVRGEVRELLPLNPNAVQVKQLDNWELKYNVILANGRTREYSQDEIWHIRIFTKDGIKGLSPIGYNREAIGLSLAAQDQGSRWFKNGTSSTGVVKTDQELSKDAFNRLRKEIAQKYSGSVNSGRPMLLEMGLDYKSIGFSAADIQFLETRKYQRDELCGVYRVPPHMIASLGDATFSNIEHQGMSFVSQSLVPYLTRIEQRALIGLLPRHEQSRYFAKFNAGALLRGDLKTRYESYATAINWGIMSPNDARELEDLNPREGGDIYLTPMNMVAGKPAAANDEKVDEDAA